MKPKNFDKTCRVCLDVSDFVTPIFGTVFKSDLPDKIAYCTGLKIQSGDGNPNKICQCCLDNLHISYIFKKTCIKNNNFFRKHFYGIKFDARVKVEKIVTKPIGNSTSSDKAKKQNEKSDSYIKIDEGSLVKNGIEPEVLYEGIEELDETEFQDDFHNYEEESQYITDNDRKDNQNEDKPAEIVENDESIIILAKDDEEDDFYWHDDEDLIRVLEKSTIPAKPEVNQIKSVEKAPNVTVRKRGNCNDERKKWQMVDEYGRPKDAEMLLIKEAAEARRQELENLCAAKPPKPIPARILPDGVPPKVKKKRIRNKIPKIRCCLVCDIVFPTRDERDAHVHAVHGGFTASVICEVCGQVFASHGSFGYHRRSHYPPEYSCRQPFCSFKAVTPSALRNHRILHEEGEEALFRYPCPQCAAKYKTASARKAHVDRAHRPRERRHACAFCEKAFYDKCKLRLHEMSHTDERPHACNTCGAKFIRHTQLRVHTLSAHGEHTPRAPLGRNRKNRIVDIYKLKDAGKIVEIEKSGQICDVDRNSENVGRNSENVGRNCENVGRNSENVGRNCENVGRNCENVGREIENVGDNSENIDKQISEFTIDNLLQDESGYEIAIGDEVCENDIIVEYVDEVVVKDMPEL